MTDELLREALEKPARIARIQTIRLEKFHRDLLIPLLVLPSLAQLMHQQGLGILLHTLGFAGVVGHLERGLQRRIQHLHLGIGSMLSVQCMGHREKLVASQVSPRDIGVEGDVCRVRFELLVRCQSLGQGFELRRCADLLGSIQGHG